MTGDQLTAEAFGTVHPAYGGGSLADLLPSVAAVLGVPGTADTLGLAPALDGVDRVAVLLVDGLGAYQMPLVTPHAPVLGELTGRTLTSGFPSTTPVSLVTLGTGTPPGAHGIVGFTLLAPDGRIVNHIRWRDDPDPAEWQPVPTMFERLAARGVATAAVTRPEFEGSGLTVSAQRGARFIGASDMADLSAGMLAALQDHAVVYGYHPDLDRCGHEDGVGTPSWTEAAAGVGKLVARLVDGLPDRSALLVTADHGQIDIPDEGRIDMATTPGLSDGVVAVAGEPRVRYVYAAPGAAADVLAAWRSVFGPSALVLTREEAIDGGWYGPVLPRHAGRIGDVVVICRDRAIALASGWEPPTVARLVAYHGSITAAEMTVPLLIARR
ncbi:MAG TPA: nucleotide pyrophosphatase/phosphodiesterase family protein [Actinoplanes sp.]|nr:nucleotide pyrophosphatase/phosphodiesterase family protein [Actinoplanes sp.]